MSGPGAIATACLALLSVWRWQDGDRGWALALAVLALVQLAVMFRRFRAGETGQGGPAVAGRPTPEAVEHARRHRPGWIIIALGGLALTAVMLPLLPIAALLLAGLSMYAALRAQSYGRVIKTATQGQAR